jgi:ABC-type sugar transport system ATPase subunit
MSNSVADLSNTSLGNEIGTIRCEGLSKAFGGQVALHDVNLTVEAGQVHSLVGQNGAGKSTLLGILSGRINPDKGRVTISGSPLHFGDPRASRGAGIACIYQQLTMAPNISACENVFLGQLVTRRGRLSTSFMRARFSELCNDFGVTIDSRAKTRTLSVAEQQILEIMRGLQAGAKVLLLDEPTAALPEEERERVYSIIAASRSAGRTVVLVSHKLDEVLLQSQQITVMRNGSVVETRKASEWVEETLIAKMAGRSGQLKALLMKDTELSEGHHSTPVLEIKDLRLPGLLSVPSLSLHRGEILGISGLVGSGRSSLLRSLAGLEPGAKGTMSINGEEVPWPREPRKALALGIALIPEDRQSAIISGQSISDNIGIGFDPSPKRKWILTRRYRRSYAQSHLQGVAFDSKRVNEPIGNLSGGNQQKALIAKWAGRNMSILLADEPTQGIDISAKTEVLAKLREIADGGRSVVIVSSEIDEILTVCNRALVLWRGEVVHEVRRNDAEWNHEGLLRLAFGKIEVRPGGND